MVSKVHGVPATRVLRFVVFVLNLSSATLELVLVHLLSGADFACLAEFSKHEARNIGSRVAGTLCTRRQQR